MAQSESFERADGTRVEVALTNAADGDFHIDGAPAELRVRRSQIMEGSWAVVRQVHGALVVNADRAMLVPDADGIVTKRLNQPIAVHGADCAPVAFVTTEGPIGVAHVGWRGLAGGIIEEMIRVLDEADALIELALIGSCIGPECYEFGETELAALEDRYGEGVRAQTANGSPALDLRAGIASALASGGVSEVRSMGGCTSCENAGFSHRARGDSSRHALVARITR